MNHNVGLIAVFLTTFTLSSCSIPTVEQDYAKSFAACDAVHGKVIDLKMGSESVSQVKCQLPDGSLTVYNAWGGLYYVDNDADGSKAECSRKSAKLAVVDGVKRCIPNNPTRKMDEWL